MLQEILREIYLVKLRATVLIGEDRIDLVYCATECGVRDLYIIGLAARELVDQLGDVVELQCTVTGAVLIIRKPEVFR